MAARTGEAVTDVDETIERDGEEIPIVLDVAWSFDPGEFVEACHPCNGYGRGWYPDITARDPKTGAAIELTDDEIQRFQEKYPPDRQPDYDCDDD